MSPARNNFSTIPQAIECVMLPGSPLLASPFPLQIPARPLISATPGHSPSRRASTRTSTTASSSWHMLLPTQTTPTQTTPALAGDTTPAPDPRPPADLGHARAFAVALGLDQDLEDCLLELAHALAGANDAGAHRGDTTPAPDPRPPADLGHARAFAVALGLDQDLEDCLLELAHALAGANDAGAHRGDTTPAPDPRPRPGSGGGERAKAYPQHFTDRSCRVPAPAMELRRAHFRRTDADTVPPVVLAEHMTAALAAGRRTDKRRWWEHTLATSLTERRRSPATAARATTTFWLETTLWRDRRSSWPVADDVCQLAEFAPRQAPGKAIAHAASALLHLALGGDSTCWRTRNRSVRRSSGEARIRIGPGSILPNGI